MKLAIAWIIVAFSATVTLAEQRRVETSRDVWISSYATEREGNNGASPKLKLKGIQEFFLIDFDPAPVRGKRVTRAQLHVHVEGAESLGRVTVSTIADQWEEGRGTGYAVTPGASSFLWTRTGERKWGGDLSDITAVINGIGGSLWGFGDASPRDEAGWQMIPIDAAVVQERIDGRCFGFAVMDDVGSEYVRSGNKFEYRNFPNRYVSSREASRKNAPFFTLWLEDGEPSKSPAASKAQPAPARGVLPPARPRPKPNALPVICRDEFGEPLPALEFFAARGEAVGFIVEAKVTSAELEGCKTALFSMPKVADHTDPLVPAGFSAAPVVSSPNDPSYIEVSIPKDTVAGLHRGALEVEGRTLPFTVTVWNFALPDRLSFIPQMNCYGLPTDVLAYYRLAHEHRTTLNHLPYGWTGAVKAAPAIRADGSFDWTEWDSRYGPLLDGTAFSDLPRASVPVDAFYLPLNENWPMDHEKHFRGGYWIENAYDDAYWQQFRNAAAAFAQHFASKGWTEPVFEFYLNNKVSFKQQRGGRWDGCSATWIFDEPMNTQDFWALRRFGVEFWKAVAPHQSARMAFRADISRPEWQRDLLDGVTSVEVVSGSLRTYRDRVISRAHRFGNLVYMYGAANRIGTPNIMPAAWCVETWSLGADGIVPWQTIGKPSAWKTPDHLSLFYPTETGPLPSLRLKAFRAGQQLVEYLTMYVALSSQDRAAVGAAALALPGMRAALEKKSDADAGTSLFGAEAHESFTSLRQALGTWLSEKAPAPRERWHDPRPRFHDPAQVRLIKALPAPEAR